MTNPKAVRHHPAAPPNPLFLRDEELIEGLELLEFAHQSLWAGQDALLAESGLGRNHERLLHLIAQRPGITMADLLNILPLSKQSQSRLLKDLALAGLIQQTPNRQDRRERLLSLTEPGREIEQRLAVSLRRRLAVAYRAAGAEAVAGYHQVLQGLIDERLMRHGRQRA